MPNLGVSLNMVSCFAFILVIGIVVDDAIIVGENIHRHSSGMRTACAAPSREHARSASRWSTPS